MSGPGTFSKIATASWVQLGSGPMAIQPTTSNVLIAIADSTPGASGFSLSPRTVLNYAGTSGVWVALRPGSIAAGCGGAVRYAWLNQILISAESRVITEQGALVATLVGP